MTPLPDASAWTLDPDLAYLNHGGFGAAPRAVLAEQQAWRGKMERNPAGFLTRELPELLDAVRDRVARFLCADAAGLVFTDNATTGTQTVIAQLKLAAGDEVLTTDHCYPAVLGQLRRATEAAGAVLQVAPVPIPAGSRAAISEAVLSRLSGRTRLVVLDHVASCSGLVFPVEEIAAECRRQGVPVLVDGAHAAGMLPVDLGRLGADFWVGNLHKWVCAPKAVAALHIAPAWRDTLRPLVASHGVLDGYQPSFDWTGTRDPSPLLAVPAALAFFDQAGWQATRQHNADLARRGAELVAQRIGTEVPAVPDGLGAAMRLVRLRQTLDEQGARALEDRLLSEHRVVVPVTFHGGRQWLRVSAQLYNTIGDYERLAEALGPREPKGRGAAWTDERSLRGGKAAPKSAPEASGGNADRWIKSVDDVLTLLDGMFAPDADRWTAGGASWWDEFYSDRSRPVPFFPAIPDENLVSYLHGGLLAPGRALDLGCGPGRNALWLARQGFDVDAVDLSPAAVAWATERAIEADVAIRFHCGDAFSLTLPPGRFDLVYDSGCLHHLPPHRRVSYLALLDRVLAPGGHLGLTCFAAGAMGCELPDEQLYRDGKLHGGLAYAPDALRSIFAGFDEVEVRPMSPQPPEAPAFGVPFLLTALFRRPGG